VRRGSRPRPGKVFVSPVSGALEGRPVYGAEEDAETCGSSEVKRDEMNCGATFVFGNASVCREGPATGWSSSSSCGGEKRARLFCGGCDGRAIGAGCCLAGGAMAGRRAGRAAAKGAAVGAGGRATGVGAGGAGAGRLLGGAETAGATSTF